MKVFEIKKPYDLATRRKLNRTCSKLEPLESHLIKPEHLFAFSTFRDARFSFKVTKLLQNAFRSIELVKDLRLRVFYQMHVYSRSLRARAW